MKPSDFIHPEDAAACGKWKIFLSSKASTKSCTECGTTNPREAKFCGEYGHMF